MQKKKIDNYTIFLDKKLGQGSFGAVYLGEEDKTNLKVAIKMLSKKTINKDEYIKQAIYSEIQILKALKSENIVLCLEVMESSNFYYIIQEYCNEGELRELMERKGTISEQEAIKVFTQICNGFVCMLSEGIIHRDLKPENVLIKDGVYKIADFGFSKKLNNKRLKNQTVVGTPLYMSIEILKSQYYTSKCDIWALGFIFYQMMHGKTPWVAGSEYQLIKNIQSKPLIINPMLSDMTKDVLTKMLRIKEKDRIDWDNLLRHPIFKGKFTAYLQNANNTLQNKLKSLMSQLRFSIKSQNIDLQRLFSKMGYNRETQLSFKHFNEFLKTIDSQLTHQQQVYIFTKLDTDDSNTISLKQLQSQMIKHNIPLKSKNRSLQKTSSLQMQKQSLESKNINQSKIISAFLKLSVKLQKNNLNLYQVFQAYDINKDGDLSINQFRRIIKKLDQSLSQSDVEYAFSLIDYDKSGTLTFQQFYNYYCKCIGQPSKNFMSKR